MDIFSARLFPQLLSVSRCSRWTVADLLCYHLILAYHTILEMCLSKFDQTADRVFHAHLFLLELSSEQAAQSFRILLLTFDLRS